MGAARFASPGSTRSPEGASGGNASKGGVDQEPMGAVAKAASLLESFPPGRGTIGVTELARRCGLPKSTTHRTLGILEALGMVERAESGYRLGMRLRQLADISVGRSPSGLRDCVLPYLLELYEETHLSVHLGMWSGTGALVIENLHGRSGGRIPPLVGREAPLHCTALGKLLLAHSDEFAQLRVLRGRLRAFTPETIVSAKNLDEQLGTIRSEGVAFSCGEFVPGIVQIAAPLRGAGRSVPAAISLSGRIGQLDTPMVMRRLRRTAHAASSACAAERVPVMQLRW